MAVLSRLFCRQNSPSLLTQSSLVLFPPPLGIVTLSLLSPGHSSPSPFMCGVANQAATLSELRRMQGLLRGSYRSYLTVCKERAKSSEGKRYPESFCSLRWKTLHVLEVVMRLCTRSTGKDLLGHVQSSPLSGSHLS